jgi:hypothetical protein
VLLALVLAAACATPQKAPPPAPDELVLALPPAALGRELHLAQRVTVLREGARFAFDAQLEADASALRLAAFALGQTVARLSWDGQRLDETHSSRTPEVVTPARIVSDVQLAFWPEAAVRAGLPPGYELVVSPARRLLLRQGLPFIEVRYEGTGPAFPRIEVDHVAHGFQLVIESTEAR